MPNGKAHQAVGVVAGACTAAYFAKNQQPGDFIIEAIGGAFGGWGGAKLPDIFDPPICPRHRSLAHGVAPVSSVGAAVLKYMQDWQEQWRNASLRQVELSNQASSGWSRFWHGLLALLYRLGAGALASLLGGYLSHIVMDAGTPAGLPFFA